MQIKFDMFHKIMSINDQITTTVKTGKNWD